MEAAVASTIISDSESAGPAVARVRRITAADLKESLREGWEDFLAMRGDLIFIGLLYPLIGLVAATVILGGPLMALLLPILAGVGLLGPIAAVGFYELARRREAGLTSNWSHFLDVRKRPAADDMGYVSMLLLAIFGLWLFTAGALYVAFFGYDAFGWQSDMSLGGFLDQVFTTGPGWALILCGIAAGALFGWAVLTLSVVSMPMLVDRDVSASEAVGTSIRATGENKGVLFRWGIIVAALLVLGSIPLFLGLAVVLPWLGYSTWHLYRRLIEPQSVNGTARV